MAFITAYTTSQVTPSIAFSYPPFLSSLTPVYGLCADTDPELRCGSEGEEACLIGVEAESPEYSCQPFTDDATPMNAVQPGRMHRPTATFMCLRCGVNGGLACNGETCEEGLTVVEDDSGNRYCESPPIG